MSAPETERWLLFEIAGHVYGLPIGGILEVAEAGLLCAVPTLPRSLAGVMNWHGETLPLLAPRVLVEAEAEFDWAAAAQADSGPATPLAARHVLVISDRRGEVPRLGLPIDSVLGIVDASNRSHAGKGSAVVVERRSIDGRVVSVLDRRRLVARAREAIEDMAA